MADLGAAVKGIWIKGMEAIGNAASNIATNTRSKVDEMNLMNRRTEILSDFGEKSYALWQKGERFPEELEEELDELQKLDERLNDLRAERLAGVKAAQEALRDEPGEEAAETEETESPEETEFPENEDAGTEKPGEDFADEAAGEQPESAQESGASAEMPDEGQEIPDDDPGNPTGEKTEEDAEEEVPVIRVEKPDADQTPSVKESIQNLFDGVPSAQEAAEKVNGALDSLEEGLRQFSGQMDQKIGELTDQLKGD